MLRYTLAPALRERKRLTPGITRRHARLKADDRRRVGGRVHAVVRRGIGETTPRLIIRVYARLDKPR